MTEDTHIKLAYSMILSTDFAYSMIIAAVFVLCALVLLFGQTFLFFIYCVGRDFDVVDLLKEISVA